MSEEGYPVPGRPAPLEIKDGANPEHICCDTSGLLQVFVADQALVLRSLRDTYQIQPLVVEAVDSEVRYKLKQKWPDRLSAYTKATRNGLVAVLNADYLASCGHAASASGTMMTAINKTGDDFYRRVDRGEAYTHAAANLLEVPTLSEDINAVFKLLDAKHKLPRPILRAFDLFMFGLQIGILDISDCARIRKLLMRCEEFVPECFAKCSFEDGLPNFYARLLDADRTRVGSENPRTRFDDRLLVRKKSQPAAGG